MGGDSSLSAIDQRINPGAQHHGRASAAVPVGAGTSPWKVLYEFVTYTYSKCNPGAFRERKPKYPSNWPMDPIETTKLDLSKVIEMARCSEMQEEAQVIRYLVEDELFLSLFSKKYDSRYRGESTKLGPWIRPLLHSGVLEYIFH